MKNCQINLEGEELVLLPQKAIYWKKEATLLIADLHLGKANHFQKAGIQLPQYNTEKDWRTLEELLINFKVKTLILLGDLFHSERNLAFNDMLAFRKKHHKINFILIQGNHDILPIEEYDKLRIEVNQNLFLNPFYLSHEPEQSNLGYNLCGHIHPGVKLKGKGRQSLRLPCFHFGKKTGVLPAFGSLTGLHLNKVKAQDRLFVISDNAVNPAM